MKAFAVFVAGFAGIALLMALCDDSLVAQEAKKDEVKKDETKKDETKTDETKMDDKKVGEKKKVVLADPQLVIKAKKQVGKI